MATIKALRGLQLHKNANCNYLVRVPNSRSRSSPSSNHSNERNVLCARPTHFRTTRMHATPTIGGAAAPGFGPQEPNVVEIMTKDPILFQDTMSIKEAVDLMVEKKISGAPVVNAEGNLVGILSESDLLWKVVGAPEDCFIVPPTYIGFLDLLLYWRDNKEFDKEVHKILAKTVGEAMTANPITISSSAAMSEAAHIILHNKINRLPVVENQKVVGVITRHDILEGMIKTRNPFL